MGPSSGVYRWYSGHVLFAVRSTTRDTRQRQITAAVCVLTDFGSLRRNSPQFTVCTDKDAVEQLVSFFPPEKWVSYKSYKN